MDGIFSGVKVLDLGRFIAGPYCGMLMADMGADVVKVEKLKGDDMRDGEAFAIHTFNRNKRCISLDFRSESGKDTLRKLIGKADVLIQNFRVGTMEKMGLGYEELQKLNPRLVVVSISGYGQYGEMRGNLALDNVVQATSGLISINGTRASGAITVSTPVCDVITAIHAAFGAVSALYDRERTGKGQYVDVAMQDCVVPYLPLYIPQHGAEGTVQGLLDESAPLSAPSAVFPTKDGHLFIFAGVSHVFRRLAELIGDEELLKPEFRDMVYRIEHAEEVKALVSKWTSQLTTAEVERLLGENDIPCSSIWNVKDIVESDWAKERQGVIYMDIPGFGPLPFPGHPLKFLTRPVTEFHPLPGLGANNAEVIAEWLGAE